MLHLVVAPIINRGRVAGEALMKTVMRPDKAN
jgi:hypothetical protein